MKPSKIAPHQWEKIGKALVYSFGSGFVGGVFLALTNALTSIQNGGHVDLTTSLVLGLVIGGVVGGLNTLAVGVKQLFTPAG